MKLSRTKRTMISSAVLVGALMMYSCDNPSVKEQQAAQNRPVISQDSAGPVLYIAQKRFDAGKVKPNQTVQGQYALYNHGQKPLEIEYVNPDCSCTGFSLSKKLIAPGDSSLLLLNMSTKDKEGVVQVHATISANTATRLYQVTLAAIVL